MLDEAGWKDLDGNPETPRQAFGIPTIFDGTPLVVNFATTKAQFRREMTEILVNSMKQCGIQANVQNLDPGQLFSPGPDGLLFGRKFDLALFGWEIGSVPPCSFFETSQIPGVKNKWLGINISGYSNSEYDALCQAARQSRPEMGDLYIQRYQALQQFFVQELPAIPLNFRLQMTMSRPDFCGNEMDVTARSALWNIENYDYGESCLP